jgi:predicted ATPase/DNA-binding CsgD family transcriptional regulator
MPSADPLRPVRIVPVPVDRPAESVEPRQRDNLPAEVSSFIGREAAIADVDEQIGSRRLVTLTGPPGVGKTQLALRVATGLRDRFRDGVWLVALAALAAPDLLASLVAATLGLNAEGGQPPAEALIAYLRGRQLLLVLDNCEHLVDACADLVTALLHACPELRILTTSREPLGTVGEICWPVPPLTLPESLALAPLVPGVTASAGHVVERAPGSVDAVLASEAGRLFVERARAVRPSLKLTADTAEPVARVCRQLDGIPLAIELAAAWAGVLSPREIADRLDDRFTLLTRIGRTAAPHQRTLRESLDWSHALLSEPERVLLRRLSIFRGGFTLGAADDVCDVGARGEGREVRRVFDDSLLIPRPSPLDVLASLIQKSLVVADDWGGETRYRFLETIREYAAERLRDAGEEARLARRHWDWYSCLAERAEPHLRGPEQDAWRARIEREHDNIRAALARTIEHDEAAPGLRICIAVWVFWWERGYTDEGYAWVSQLLALPSASDRTPARAAGLFVAAKLATDSADLATALALCQESLEIAREQHDPHTLHRTLTQLGHIERGRGRWRAARRYYEEALPLRRELGDPVSVAISLSCLGDCARALHEYETARALYLESLDLAQQQGHPGEITATQHDLGLLAYQQGRYDEATAWFAEALPVAHRINYPRRIAYLLEGFAALAVRQQPDRALRLAGAAAAVRMAGGCRLAPSEQAPLTRKLTPAHAALGDHGAAEALAAGAALTVEQAVALALSPLPAVVGAASAATPTPSDRLTAREREVAALVARGLTNRQIADALIVSQRTAESHVANSLGKLGLGSRAQLAAWAIAQGLVVLADLPLA